MEFEPIETETLPANLEPANGDINQLEALDFDAVDTSGLESPNPTSGKFSASLTSFLLLKNLD